MTIAEAISKVDATKPNTYERSIKIEWLANLDARIKTQIIDAHECSEPIFFYGYDEMMRIRSCSYRFPMMRCICGGWKQ